MIVFDDVAGERNEPLPIERWRAAWFDARELAGVRPEPHVKRNQQTAPPP